MLKFLVKLSCLLILCLINSCTSSNGVVTAPNFGAKGINQIPIHKNGCGPASLISAYRLGSKKWNQALQHIEGGTDTEKFNYLVKHYGNVSSRYLHFQKRFGVQGINIADLKDLANDFHSKNKLDLPDLKCHSHYLEGKMDHIGLLKSTHDSLRKSLSKGFPPIMSIKTFALDGSSWKQIHGHYVVLFEMPSSLASDVTSFEIKYMDPWGGDIKKGMIKVPEKDFYVMNTVKGKLHSRKSPLLEIGFPDSSLGTETLKPNQKFITTIAFSINPEFEDLSSSF